MAKQSTSRTKSLSAADDVTGGGVVAGVAPPPKGWAMAGWALLPLRLFVGFTMTFAGLQKIANPSFFDSSSQSGIFAQMAAAQRNHAPWPMSVLLPHLLQFAGPLGWVMAFGELAVGLGLLVGLWTRIAAIGGAAIAFSLFLTVSFHQSPYYTGSDIVFFFAFVPFVLAGNGGVLSVDGWIAKKAAREAKSGEPTLVPVSFSTIQTICGNYDAGRCSALGTSCAIAPCPILKADNPTVVASRHIDDVERRKLVLGGVIAAAAGFGALVVGGLTAAIGRMSSNGTSNHPSALPTTTSGGSTPTTNSNLGTLIGAASAVPVGGTATITLASSGDPGIVYQPTAGQFLAFDALCPHAGCTVNAQPSGGLFICPCHGSQFNALTGAVEVGPATNGLTQYTVTKGPDGNLYLKA